MIKVGDNVRVITGSNKGKEGKVLKVFRSENKVSPTFCYRFVSLSLKSFSINLF